MNRKNMELGKVYKRFKSKKGNEVILRTPKWEDLDQCLEFVNKISAEDTFVSFSGEKITREEEIDWLANAVKAMEKEETLYLWAFINDKLVGTSEIGKGKHRNRNKHVGYLGIMIDEDCREEGIGTEMLNTLIEEAKNFQMKVLVISAFANNSRAIHTYEKVGFKHCGRIPKSILYKNEHIDEVVLFREP